MGKKRVYTRISSWFQYVKIHCDLTHYESKEKIEQECLITCQKALSTIQHLSLSKKDKKK